MAESSMSNLFFSRLLVATCLLLTVCLATGCGGGKTKKKGNLTAEYDKAMGQSNPSTKVTELVRVAAKLKENGDRKTAEAAVAAAEESIAKIEDETKKANAMGQVASAQAKLGLLVEAGATLDKLSEAAKGMEDPVAKATAYSSMASAYSAMDNADTASAYLSKAGTSAAAIEDPEIRVDSLVAIAIVANEVGDEADKRITAANDAAMAIEDDLLKAKAQATVAKGYIKMDREEEGKAAFAEAEKLGGSLGDAQKNAYLLIHISDQWFAAGNKTEAKSALSRAQKVAEDISNAGEKTSVFDTINGRKAAM